MAYDLAALIKRRDEQMARAQAAALTAEEQEASDALEAIKEAEAAEAVALRKRRALDLDALLLRARARFPEHVLLKPVDLVGCFELGLAPPSSKMPNGGLVVVRSPEPDVYHTAARELETKARDMALVLADLFLGCVVEPDPQGVEALKLSEFVKNFPAVATSLGNEIYSLGGMKAQAIKRGRA
jgi:hypothetical protein